MIARVRCTLPFVRCALRWVSMQGSAAGTRMKGTSQSGAESDKGSVSEELDRLMQETEQQKTSASTDLRTIGSNADRLNEYLQKLQKDLDECLKDRYVLHSFAYCIHSKKVVLSIRFYNPENASEGQEPNCLNVKRLQQ